MNAFGKTCKLISGADIEKNIDEDYHIYMICSCQKSYFIGNSVEFDNTGLKCKVKISDGSILNIDCFLKEFQNNIITSITYNFSHDKSRIILNYFKNFRKVEKELFSANDAVIYGSGKRTSNDLKVLYIGQSQGIKGKSTSCKRLINHKTFQQILIDINEFGSDEDVYIFLLQFEFKGVAVASPGDNRFTRDRFFNFYDSKNKLAFRTSVNAIETFLINSFKPKYNKDFVNHMFKITSNGKWSYFYRYKFDYFIIEMFFPEFTETKKFPYPCFNLLTDTISFSTNSKNVIYYKLGDNEFIFDGIEK